MVFYVKTIRATPAEIQAATSDASSLSRRSSRVASPLEAARITSNSRRPSLSAALSSPALLSAPAQARHHILLVEDNLVNQKVLTKQLLRAGCNVHTANHGQEALDFLRTTRYWRDNNGSGAEVSVILMDWEMPIKDGVSATREIRELEASGAITKHLHIIATTANARAEQVAVAMEAGMVSH